MKDLPYLEVGATLVIDLLDVAMEIQTVGRTRCWPNLASALLVLPLTPLIVAAFSKTAALQLFFTHLYPLLRHVQTHSKRPGKYNNCR